MITVFICDDDHVYREKYTKLINEAANENNLIVSVMAFESSIEMFFLLDDITILPDIVYMDVEMPTMNGVAAAQKLREKEISSEIIFISNDKDYVFDVFDVHPANYLLKYNTSDTKFKEIFLKAVSKSQDNLQTLLTYQNKNFQYTIPVSQIVSIEIQKRIIVVRKSNNETVEFYGTMKDVWKQVDNTSLIRIQRSYIINISYLKRFGKHHVELKDGSVYPVGKVYAQSLEDHFITFLDKSEPK